MHPEMCAPVQLLSHGSDLTTAAEFTALHNFIEFLLKTEHQGLNFVPLDLDTARLVLLTDTSFANAEGLKSQLGYILLMIDDEG